MRATSNISWLVFIIITYFFLPEEDGQESSRSPLKFVYNLWPGIVLRYNFASGDPWNYSCRSTGRADATRSLRSPWLLAPLRSNQNISRWESLRISEVFGYSHSHQLRLMRIESHVDAVRNAKNGICSVTGPTRPGRRWNNQPNTHFESSLWKLPAKVGAVSPSSISTTIRPIEIMGHNLGFISRHLVGFT